MRECSPPYTTVYGSQPPVGLDLVAIVLKPVCKAITWPNNSIGAPKSKTNPEPLNGAASTNRRP